MSDTFHAVAIDYDGTLARADTPHEEALEALAEIRAAGRRVILVTGRILEELRGVFPGVDAHFDAIVAENGAVLSVEGTTRLLSSPVEFELDEALVAQAVPFRRGQVLLATWSPHEAVVSREIARLGLECQIARNRGEVMLLPAGISKGFGIYQALGDLGVSHHSALGIGDAENDHSLLRTCEIGVAVADAVPGLKRHADVVLEKPGGAALAELLRSAVLHGELEVPTRRWRIELGRGDDGQRVDLPASRINLLVTGRSQSGKSFLTGLLAEQLIGLGYSVCLVDPEGDYASLGSLRGVLHLGGREPLPPPEGVGRLVEHRFGSVLVDLSLVEESQRLGYVERLLRRLEEERAATGLPHWILCDEAHASLAGLGLGRMLGETSLRGICAVTYRPDSLGSSLQDSVDFVLAILGGKRSDGVPDPIALLEELLEQELDDREVGSPGRGLLVDTRGQEQARPFEIGLRRRPHVRHWHKYFHGALPPRLHFHFSTDAGERLEAAANVAEFRRGLLASEWPVLRHHARRCDFSRWSAEALQDAELAREVEGLENAFRSSERSQSDAERLRDGLVAAIERRYAE